MSFGAPSQGGYNLVESPLNTRFPSRSTLVFVGAGVSVADDSTDGVTTVTITGTSSGTVTSVSGTTPNIAFFTAPDVIGGDTALNWDNVNKRLGVGTATPTWPITAVASNKPGIVQSDGTVSVGISIDSTNHHGILGTISAHSLEFETSSTVWAVLNTSGQLQLDATGTLSPQSQFEVLYADATTALASVTEATGAALRNKNTTDNNWTLLQFNGQNGSNSPFIGGRAGIQVLSHAGGGETTNFVLTAKTGGTESEVLRSTGVATTLNTATTFFASTQLLSSLTGLGIQPAGTNARFLLVVGPNGTSTNTDISLVNTSAGVSGSANFEQFNFGWSVPNTFWQIFSNVGGTGTLRDIRMAADLTSANLVSGLAQQVVLAATGFVGVQDSAPDCALSIGSPVGVSNAAAVKLAGGSTVAVSDVNTGRLRFNQSTQHFEISENGGAYATLSSGGGGGTVTGTGAANQLAFWSGTSAITSGTGITTSATNILELISTSKTVGSGNGNLAVITSDTEAVDVGGSIVLGGQITGTTNPTPFGYIWGRKSNSTTSNQDGYLAFGTRQNAGTATEWARITAAGNVGIQTAAPLTTLQLINQGFVGDTDVVGVTSLVLQSQTTNARTLFALVPNGTSTNADFLLFDSNVYHNSTTTQWFQIGRTTAAWQIVTNKIGGGTQRPIIIDATGAGTPTQLTFATSGLITTGAGFTIVGAFLHSGTTLGVLGHAAVSQQTALGTTTGFTPHTSANAVFNESTFTGGSGASAYTLSDMVLALKNYGLLAA